MQIATAEQMRSMDQRAIEEAGIPSALLMERAAEGLMKAVLEVCGRSGEQEERGKASMEEEGPGAGGAQAGRKELGKCRVAIFAGPGNNGGDGVAVARLLLERGFDVRAFLVGKRERMTGDSQEMERRLLKAGGCLEDFAPEDGAQRAWCMEADVVVDALFGIGLHSEIRGAAEEAVAWMNACPGKVIAADIASGIEADTGRILGNAVKAAVTVTFTCPKAGHFVGKGALYTGRLVIHDIGIPEDIRRVVMEKKASMKPDGLAGELPENGDGPDEGRPGGGGENRLSLDVLTLREAAGLLPPRPEDGHKGTFGKVYVLGGSTGLTGAPLFSASAAVRSGSGLVFAGVPRQIYAIVAGKCQEAMASPLPCDQEGRLIMEALWSASNRMEQCDAALIGPGLGRSRDVERLVCKLLSRISIPLVLDADGIYAVRNRKELLKERASRGWATILTPHDGEFTCLGGDLSGQQRLREAQRFAAEYGCVLVLKGHGTIIAGPDGRTLVNATGNCGMAKGGSGDVLAGMILSFLGQGMEPLQAAALAVWMHGRAGDMCARDLSVYAMTPGDLVEYLPRVFGELLIREA